MAYNETTGDSQGTAKENTEKMTKFSFMVAYRAELIATYPWARVNDKLDRFMDIVIDALYGGNYWNFKGDAVDAAWKSIGGKGNPTLKDLRALPDC